MAIEPCLFLWVDHSPLTKYSQPSIAACPRYPKIEWISGAPDPRSHRPNESPTTIIYLVHLNAVIVESSKNPATGHHADALTFVQLF